MSCTLDESILFHNITLFKTRFPDLYKLLRFDQYPPATLLKIIPKEYEMIHSLKDDSFTLKIKDKYIHSKYNPILEGKKIFSSIKENYVPNTQACFLGLGLAYHVESFIKENKNESIILVEPDVFIFILFLTSRKLDFIFSHSSLVVIPATSPSETIAILENLGATSIFHFNPSLQVSRNWFVEFNTLKIRHKKKYLLNCNTMKKFYIRWLKNFIKNFHFVSSLPSISIFKNAFSNVPCLIFAAGPSLDKHIQELKDIKEKFIIIAVDTSLKILLKCGIIPDFVLLMDSQYLNYLHVAGVNAPDSVLITEASVYPSVFSSNFKAKCLVSSFFPLGKYVEGKIGNNESLSAGGSVATTAWDFARFMDCNPIIMAGLDLAFTKNKTHSLACKFEKDAMLLSDRFSSLEKTSYKMLDIKNTENAEGYKGKVLTDSKMKMFAWWFESKIEEYPNIKTYNFMAEGLKIPNMLSIEKKELLGIISKKEEKNNNRIHRILEKSNKNAQLTKKTYDFSEIYISFKYILELVNEAIQCLEKSPHLNRLQIINEKIKKCEIYLHTGFDVVIKTIEAEFEIFEFSTQKEKLKKLNQLYSMLKNILIESVDLLNIT